MRPRQFGLIVHDQPRATPGFTLYAPMWRNKVLLLNMRGDEVHEWTLPGNPAGYAYLLPNGNLLAATTTDGGPPFKGGAKGGLIQELDWHGNVVCEVRDDWQHHDFRKLRNGNIIYPAWEKMPPDAIAKVSGGVPDSIPEFGVYSDLLREVTPAGETVWEWRIGEHMDIAAFPMHPLCTWRVYCWINACSETTDGNILISMRQINTVAIIDRQTKQFVWWKRDDAWGHQHDVQQLSNGNFLLFANGQNTLYPHNHSFVTEFTADGEVVWEYRDNPRTFFYSPHISGCQRLWSGNTLICEGVNGRLFEVTPTGEIVWEFLNPYFDRMFLGDDVNWVFRAYRYAEDSPEIAGRLKL